MSRDATNVRRGEQSRERFGTPGFLPAWLWADSDDPGQYRIHRSAAVGAMEDRIRFGPVRPLR